MAKYNKTRNEFNPRRLYASDINKQMQKIRDNVTKRSYIDHMEIRQRYGVILKESQPGGKGSPIRAEVMTFREAFDAMKKANKSNFKPSDFTKDVYEGIVNSLVGDIKASGRWTVHGEKQTQIEHMQKVLTEEITDWLSEDEGIDIDFNKDFEKLKEAFERVKDHPKSGVKAGFESGGEYIDALVKAYLDILEGN